MELQDAVSTKAFYEHNIENIIVSFKKKQWNTCNSVLCQISELCTKIGLILIVLYPKTTRILQPADVIVFRCIKESRRKVLL